MLVGDNFVRAGGGSGGGRSIDRSGRGKFGGGIDRQIEREARAAPRRAVDEDASAVGTHDLVREVQAEAGALADVLGREERIEDVVADLGRDAAAGVTDHQPHAPAPRVQLGADRQPVLGGPLHGVAGVDDQVQQYLCELAGRADDRRQVFGVAGVDPGAALADFRAGDAEHARDQLRDLGAGDLTLVEPAEAADGLDDGLDAGGAVGAVFEQLHQLGCRFLAHEGFGGDQRASELQRACIGVGAGLLCGLLGALPSMMWALDATTLAVAPLLMPVLVWLYTVVFAFATLWFAHYTLAALDRLRAGAAAGSTQELPP